MNRNDVLFLHIFSHSPSFSLKRRAFFQIRTPQVLFLPAQQLLRKSPTARTAGRCDRRGARTTPRLCPASPLAASPSAESRLQASFFCVYHFRNAPVQRRNVRSSGFRLVHARLGCESGTNCRHGRDSVEAAYYPVLFSAAESACTAISSSSCAICSSGRRIKLSSGLSLEPRCIP